LIRLIRRFDTSLVDPLFADGFRPDASNIGEAVRLCPRGFPVQQEMAEAIAGSLVQSFHV
jgi:hypothetical protein